jgi:hypothetical protein
MTSPLFEMATFEKRLFEISTLDRLGEQSIAAVFRR